ncbi:MAG: hypothetical protein NTZ16_15085 [Verrucomicrobia bacterium]|nr:hypothetical protein [Verrucomicrobiota bacterium]
MKKTIKLRVAQVLAAGFCLLSVTGCNNASAPKGEVTVAELNQAVAVLSVGGGAPKTVDVLTNFPAFKGRPFPVPPVGKKFIIDPSTCKVVVVNM